MVQPTSTKNEAAARLVRSPDCIPPWRHVNTYLLNGAVKNMAVDGGGGSPQVFSYTPPANYDFAAARIISYLQTSSAMSVNVFGDLAAALGQGIEFKAAGVLISTWQDNIDMYTDFYDKATLANVSDAPADTTAVCRWTFWKDTNGLAILIPNGLSLEVVINDDLSTLTELRMKLKGKLFPAAP